MLRDRVGSIATNVVYTEGQQRKSDIYGLVATECEKMFRCDVIGDDSVKAQWANYILAKNLMTRKITKKAVMTLPYGVSYGSATKYVEKALDEEYPFIKNDISKTHKSAFVNYVGKSRDTLRPSFVDSQH